MTCARCVQRVEKALRAVRGVRTARVDLAGAKVEVTFDTSVATLTGLREAVRRRGYTPGD